MDLLEGTALEEGIPLAGKKNAYGADFQGAPYHDYGDVGNQGTAGNCDRYNLKGGLQDFVWVPGASGIRLAGRRGLPGAGEAWETRISEERRNLNRGDAEKKKRRRIPGARPFVGSSCSFLLRVSASPRLFFFLFSSKPASQAISRRLKGPAAPLSRFNQGPKEGAQPTWNPEAPLKGLDSWYGRLNNQAGSAFPDPNGNVYPDWMPWTRTWHGRPNPLDPVSGQFFPVVPAGKATQKRTNP